MFRLTSSLHASGRARTLIPACLALAACVALAAWSSSARASGCTNTFTNAAGGSWFSAANWSKGKVPSSTEEACITENGTYTVEMAQGANVTVKSLIVGGTSGTQTLAVESTSSVNALLTTSEGLAIGAHGAATMTNNATDKDENSVTLVGPITNAGTLSSEKGNGNGGGRAIQGSVTNTGTLQINHSTEYSGEATTLENEGTLDLAEGTALKVSDKSGVVNGLGGKVVATGSGEVSVAGSGTSFTEGAGTTSGSLPVIVDDSALRYSGSGASLIAVRGTSTLAGSLSSGQSLQIQSSSGENANVTAGASFTNAGSITLTNASDGDENSQTLVIAKGETLTNSGTLTMEKGNGSGGGGRAIQGSVTNTGSLQINHSTEYDGESATLTNDGTLEVANEKALHVTDKSGVVNGPGADIAGVGSGEVFVQGSGTSFTEGAGTTSGSLPVIVDDSALSYTGSGASLIAVRGTIVLAGNISAGQSLIVQSSSGENANVTAGASFTNAGSITLTNASDGDENSQTLVIAKGETLTNSGTLTMEKGNGGGGRTIQGNITNTGSLQINHTTGYDGEPERLLNEGAIVIASGVSLNVTDSSAVVNGAGGNIEGIGSGALSQRSGSFEEGTGKTTGTLPVVLDDLALKYAGNGASTIALRGTSTLSGPISAGQTLLAQSSSGENANITAASFTNSGKLVLANAADGDANSVTVNLAGGTLTNASAKGSTLEVERANGGNRTIEGNVVNEGTVASSGTLKVTGSFTETGKKPIVKLTIAGSSAFGSLSITGPATILNELELVQVKPFVPTVGEKFVILSSAALTGTFTKVKKNKIKKAEAKVYTPIYSATAVTLEAQT